MRTRRGERARHFPHEVRGLRFRRLAILSVFLTLVLSGPLAVAQVPPPGEGGTQTATANGTPLFGLRPGLYGKTTLEKGHYQYAVNPGAAIDDSVEVLNLTDKSLTLKLYGADLNQSEGAVSAAQASEEQKGVGKWLVLDRSELTLGPNDSTKVPFHVNVPAQLRPGDHLGAVVASTTTTEQRPGAFAVESRVGLMVRVRIPGEAILDAEVGPLQVANAGGDRRFTVEVRNTGTLLFDVEGQVEIRSGDSAVAKLEVAPENIYVIPGGKATFEAVWTSTPLFGGRTAQAIFRLAADEEPTKTVRSEELGLSFFSWLVVLIAALVAIAVIVLLIRRARRRSSSEPDGFDHALMASSDRFS